MAEFFPMDFATNDQRLLKRSSYRGYLSLTPEEIERAHVDQSAIHNWAMCDEIQSMVLGNWSLSELDIEKIIAKINQRHDIQPNSSQMKNPKAQQNERKSDTRWSELEAAVGLYKQTKLNLSKVYAYRELFSYPSNVMIADVSPELTAKRNCDAIGGLKRLVWVTAKYLLKQLENGGHIDVGVWPTVDRKPRHWKPELRPFSFERKFGGFRSRRRGLVSCCGLALITGLPCATAILLSGPSVLGNKRTIIGVTSTSAGLALLPLQTEDDYVALRGLLQAFWICTYAAFLGLVYRRLRRLRQRDGPIYLFCALLLAAHFIFGFAGSADTTEEATKGMLMFGPLVATLCAALVYIPFSQRAIDRAHDTQNVEVAASGQSSSGLDNSSDEVRNRIEHGEEAQTSESSSSRPVSIRHEDGNGDIGLVQRVSGAVMGWVM